MSAIPKINPLGTSSNRPFWSVMIPTYRPDATYLRQALESVLQQAPGPEQMQIEVVDDCSPGMDVAALLKSIAGEQVQFSRTPKNLGLAGCWNTCIERARGEWVHILHQDDWVLPGFYQTLAKATERHPEVGLIATRSFFVDAESIILEVTSRLRHLENGGRTVDAFFYGTPIQCPGVVVKRTAYETHGGFLSDLLYTLDCEMWARIVGARGGLVTSEVLACYRTSDSNESGRLSRTAEGLHDHNRLHQIFAERYPGFDAKKARQRVCNMALGQAMRFSRDGETEAAKANWDFWKQNAPFEMRLRRIVGKLARGIFR